MAGANTIGEFKATLKQDAIECNNVEVCVLPQNCIVNSLHLILNSKTVFILRQKKSCKKVAVLNF